MVDDQLRLHGTVLLLYTCMVGSMPPHMHPVLPRLLCLRERPRAPLHQHTCSSICASSLAFTVCSFAFVSSPSSFTSS